MTVRELFEYFLKDAHWVNRETTIDNIHFGDENTQVIKVGTGWSACAANLQAAAEGGCNLFISHELPFGWERRNDVQALPSYQKCVRILQENNMVEMNLHDTWDHYPGIGIRDGFAKLLGLGELVQELDYIHPGQTAVTTGGKSLGIYRIPPTKASDFAKIMCRRMAAVGAPGLCLNGDTEQIVDKVAIGVGCHVPSLEAFNAGAQLLVDVYDRHSQERSRIPLAECDGISLVTVEHSMAETYAMKLMAEHITEKFGIEAIYYHNEPLGTYYTP